MKNNNCLLLAYLIYLIQTSTCSWKKSIVNANFNVTALNSTADCLAAKQAMIRQVSGVNQKGDVFQYGKIDDLFTKFFKVKN